MASHSNIRIMHFRKTVSRLSHIIALDEIKTGAKRSLTFYTATVPEARKRGAGEEGGRSRLVATYKYYENKHFNLAYVVLTVKCPAMFLIVKL